MHHDRHWSKDEANAALDRLAPKVRALREHLDHLRSPEVVERLADAAGEPGGAYPGYDIARAAVELAFGLRDLAEQEIVVRDLDRGLIDFPALRDGREVYLCWLCGEPEVTHWHEPESGFAGREPLA